MSNIELYNPNRKYQEGDLIRYPTANGTGTIIFAYRERYHKDLTADNLPLGKNSKHMEDYL